jgi:hypothetical protein
MTASTCGTTAKDKVYIAVFIIWVVAMATIVSLDSGIRLLGLPVRNQASLNQLNGGDGDFLAMHATRWGVNIVRVGVAASVAAMGTLISWTIIWFGGRKTRKQKGVHSEVD